VLLKAVARLVVPPVVAVALRETASPGQTDVGFAAAVTGICETVTVAGFEVETQDVPLLTVTL